MDPELLAIYILRKSFIVVDQLSRKDQVIRMEWSLNQEVAKSPLNLWQGPTIDPCVTATMPRCYCTVPRYQTRGRAMQDAYQHPWDIMDLYTFPLFSQLQKILNSTSPRAYG